MFAVATTEWFSLGFMVGNLSGRRGVIDLLQLVQPLGHASPFAVVVAQNIPLEGTHFGILVVNPSGRTGHPRRKPQILPFNDALRIQMNPQII